MKWKTKSLFDGTLPLRKKLIIVYLLAAVLPILIITIMISAIYYRSILENAYSLIDQNNQTNEILVRKQLDDYHEVLYEFAWNDLAYSMTFNTKDAFRPMTSAIYTFMNQYGTQWNKIMAYGVLLILPCCIIFVTMQKHIVEGMTSGSVKG